jgi:hypothetical protein
MQDNKINIKLVYAKRQKFSYIREQGIRSAALIKLEYNFISKEVKIKGLQLKYNTFILPFTSVTPPSSNSLRLFISLKDNN